MDICGVAAVPADPTEPFMERFGEERHEDRF